MATKFLSPYVRYFFCYEKIVEEFEHSVNRLTIKRQQQNEEVKARSPTEEIMESVLQWLEKAEKELEEKEIQSLKAEMDRTCFSWCPSWGWRFCLSKKLAEKTLCMNRLIESCCVGQLIGRRRPLQGIDFSPSEDFMSSKSSNLAFDKIMSALYTDGVNMIALYGMPGVGKTTLAKEVKRQAEEQEHFHKVLMVTMSQSPNFSDIQDRIAELLGFPLNPSTKEGKADQLWMKLKDLEKFLIIIDDVWERFELKTVGIPFGAEQKGCKILLTTRVESVCANMNCEETIELEILDKDEAWDLFKHYANLKDDPSTLIDVAKEVASECKGLPLAIKIIGETLKGETLDKWTAVNLRLKDSRPLDNEEVCEPIYNCLLVSYEFLRREKFQLCLLLCSLFPEDFRVNIELLITFGIGYGLFSNISSMERLRIEICDAIRYLQKSGLLLKVDYDDERYVSMHDVVRDFCHWKTSTGEIIFTVKDKLTEWPMDESFECCTAISFWYSNINYFPEELKFSKLKILVFNGRNSVRVPSTFFETMEALRVLYLKNVTLSLKVLKFVRNLRTLCFEYCNLKNISSLRNLKNLEILALRDTGIYELPEELVALHRLKSLHFSNYFKDKESSFPPNLLSRLTSLQELHVTCPNNINLSELNSLSGLTALSLRVSTAQCSQENFVFSAKLERYMIVTENRWPRYMWGLKFRTLQINEFSSSLSAFKELFCNVEKLDLDAVSELKNIVPSVDQKGLNELNSLWLGRCNDMKYLMDTTRENGPTTVFSKLVKLDMYDLSCLEELCHGPPSISFLQKLKDVSITFCDCLKVLFQMDGSLEKEEIVELEEYQVVPLSNLTSLELAELPKLKWIWKEPSHCFSLKSLKYVQIINCSSLKYLFSLSLAQSLVLLEKLEIKSCRELEHIITESENDDNIESDSGHLHHPLFPKLTSLEIRECERLEYVCQIPLAQGLPHLQSLDITDAPKLKHVFNVAKEKNAVDHAIALPRLQLLRLGNLINLSRFCPENYPIMSPSLEELSVWNCPQLEFFNIQQEVNKEIQLKELFLKGVRNECYTTIWEKIFQIQTEEIALRYTHQLQGRIQFPSLKYLRYLTMSDFNRLKFLFSSMVARNLTQLSSLGIEYCEKLEKIIEMDQTSIASSSHAHIQPIFFPSLEVIRIKGCSNLKSLFPISVTRSLSKLKEICIHRASKLEQVFGYQVELNAEDNQTEIVFPTLQSLELLELPSLKSFAPTGYHFQFPSLRSFEATTCHKLTTSLSMDSKHHMHAITEETPQATKDFNTVEGIVDNQSKHSRNDIIWIRRAVEGQMPLYMNVGETKIMLRKEVKK